jgi:hypothetical protein
MGAGTAVGRKTGANAAPARKVGPRRSFLLDVVVPRQHAAVAATFAACAALAALTPAAGGHRPAGPTEPCGAGNPAVRAKGAWTTIQAPADLAGPITTHAAGGTDARYLLASDGATVQRSSDGGCTWQPSYDAAADGIPGVGVVPGVTPSVREVTYPSGSGTRGVLVLDGVGGELAARMLLTDDQGATWRPGGDGLPAVGRITSVVGMAALPDVVYATVSTGADATGALYASTDGGATFAQRSSGSVVRRLAVDPLDADRVWAVRADGTVARSGDGGRTFLALTLPTRDGVPATNEAEQLLAGTEPDPDKAWRDIAVAHAPGRPAVVALAAAFSADAAVFRVLASIDGGKTFLDLPTEGLGPAAGLAFGNSDAQLLMAGASGSTAFRGPGLHVYDLGETAWRDVDDQDLIGLREVRTVRLDGARRGHDGLVGLQLRQDTSGGQGTTSGAPVIARYEPPDASPGALVTRTNCVAGGLGAGAGETEDEDARDPAVAFEPDPVRVQLAPGLPARIPLRATLSKVPARLDVSFLIDSSDSMDPAVAGVRCSVERLVRDLRRKRIDGWFGLGTYNDRVEYRYRRLVDLSPPSKVFTDALEDLRTILGREETMRSALFQTATGAGLVATVTDKYQRAGKVLVEPGRQANFRPDALKLVIVIADEPYGPDDPGAPDTPDEPSAAATVDALQAKGIRAVGIRVTPQSVLDTLNPSQKTSFASRQLLLLNQLREFARGSGAVAPAGGVDCDGGGTPDIATGQPLVCSVNEAGIQRGLGDTIATILASIEDRREVRLVAVEKSGLEVAVEHGDLGSVDVRRRHVLEAAATVSCTPAQAGKRYPLQFAVMAGGTRVGSLAGVATCGALAAAVTSLRVQVQG